MAASESLNFLTPPISSCIAEYIIFLSAWSLSSTLLVCERINKDWDDLLGVWLTMRSPEGFWLRARVTPLEFRNHFYLSWTNNAVNSAFVIAELYKALKHYVNKSGSCHPANFSLLCYIGFHTNVTLYIWYVFGWYEYIGCCPNIDLAECIEYSMLLCIENVFTVISLFQHIL